MIKIKRGDMSLVVKDDIAMLVKDPTQEVIARIDTSNDSVADALFDVFLEENNVISLNSKKNKEKLA